MAEQFKKFEKETNTTLNLNISRNKFFRGNNPLEKMIPVKNYPRLNKKNYSTCVYPIVEYKRGEDMNPEYSTDVWFVEVYDLTKCLAPLFGTGTMDVI
jgi:hypothetical protein